MLLKPKFFLTAAIMCLIWRRIDGQVPERCDVINAVLCFSKMAEVPRPHMLTDIPDLEILQPCKEQVNKNSDLKTCINHFLDGCQTILEDANKMINASEAFCAGCLGCINFTDDYRDGLLCTVNMFNDLISPGDSSKQQNCRQFTSCLGDVVVRCPALTSFLFEYWKLFESTCHRVNVTAPDKLMKEQNSPVLVCSELDSITLAISDCYNYLLLGVGSEENLEVTKYCYEVRQYQECVKNAALSCPRFHEIFKSSVNDFLLAVQPLCGENLDIHSVCDFDGLNRCFQAIDARLWKLEKYDIERLRVKGSLIDYIKQLTDPFRDFNSVCVDVPDALNTTNSCLQSFLSLCPQPLKEAYHMNANYLEGLCNSVSNCANHSSAIGKCGEEAFAAMKKVDEAMNISEYQHNFCLIFHDWMVCLNKEFTECTDANEHIRGLYIMLADDLLPICNKTIFRDFVTDNALSDSLKTFLDCRYMPVISYELGKCTQSYLYDIGMNHTNQYEICRALDAWENCTKNNLLDCAVLQQHVGSVVEKTRSQLESVCPRKTTVSSPTTAPAFTDTLAVTTVSSNSSRGTGTRLKCTLGPLLLMASLLQIWI